MIIVEIRELHQLLLHYLPQLPNAIGSKIPISNTFLNQKKKKKKPHKTLNNFATNSKTQFKNFDHKIHKSGHGFKPPLKLGKKQFEYIYIEPLRFSLKVETKKKPNKNCPIRFCSKRKRFQGFSRENERESVIENI